ncbi:SRPBCC domain-containing protein [Mucilaginibacter sp. HC2]|uniref:SRPBCC family protein n=1 Tax=Mucilaginibacter inviolabilis TaxID=2714892 RepID=UPI0014081875|nr:SRPBCC domain-containing protein [Mucilaginibacter inviolabilis]NHA04531.1 SRPBCC domain-containing protein [Mucilaginibacter inviolabilis]
MKRDLVIKWHFPHSPEKVWECITNPELISQWLMKNDFKPVVGHQFQFHSKPLPKMGWDGIVYCEVLEVIPNQKLVYTWKGGPRPGIIGLDTLLTWTLSPDGEGTRLVLEHSGFKGLKNMLSSIFMESGWKKHITRRMIKILNEIPGV